MEKTSFRRAILSRRIKEHTPAVEAMIARNIVEFLQKHPVKRLGIYWPILGEVDVRAVATDLVRKKVVSELALPCVLGNAMSYRHYASGQRVFLDDAGVPAPISNEEVPVEAILVPAIAIDAQGFRLGYGKGYFDRFLAANPCVWSIGLTAEAFFGLLFPLEPHDMRLRAAITEKAIRIFQFAP